MVRSTYTERVRTRALMGLAAGLMAAALFPKVAEQYPQIDEPGSAVTLYMPDGFGHSADPYSASVPTPTPTQIEPMSYYKGFDGLDRSGSMVTLPTKNNVRDIQDLLLHLGDKSGSRPWFSSYHDLGNSFLDYFPLDSQFGPEVRRPILDLIEPKAHQIMEAFSQRNPDSSAASLSDLLTRRKIFAHRVEPQDEGASATPSPGSYLLVVTEKVQYPALRSFYKLDHEPVYTPMPTSPPAPTSTPMPTSIPSL